MYAAALLNHWYDIFNFQFLISRKLELTILSRKSEEIKGFPNS